MPKQKKMQMTLQNALCIADVESDCRTTSGTMQDLDFYRLDLDVYIRGFLHFSLSQPLPQPPPVVKIFPKLFISLVTILPF